MALVTVDKSKSPVDIEAKPGIVGGKYYVDKRVGEGSFGVIYKGKPAKDKKSLISKLLHFIVIVITIMCLFQVSNAEEITELQSNS